MWSNQSWLLGRIWSNQNTRSEFFVSISCEILVNFMANQFEELLWMRGLFDLNPAAEPGVYLEEQCGPILCALFDIGGHKRTANSVVWATQDASLKTNWLQFEAGQVFRQVSLNENNVLSLNIEGNSRHLFDLPGYNYLGRWSMRIQATDRNYAHTYTALFGGESTALGYLNEETIIRPTPLGIFISAMECNERATLFPAGTSLSGVHINLLNGEMTGSTTLDGKTFSYPFELVLSLKPESIPNAFLKEAMDAGVISGYEYQEALTRRFDVEGPNRLINNVRPTKKSKSSKSKTK